MALHRNIKHLLTISSLVGVAVDFGLAIHGWDARTVLAESDSRIDILRESRSGADSSSGRIVLQIAVAQNTGEKNAPGQEHVEPPVEPIEPNTEADENGPTFFGEPVGKEMVLVLDCSSSMKASIAATFEDQNGDIVSAATRLDLVKAEAIKTLSQLTDETRFDIVQLAGCDSTFVDNALPVTRRWCGALVDGSQENRDAAIAFITGMTTWGGTPSATALEIACTQYGDSLDSLFFLTDGAPTWWDIPGQDAPIKGSKIGLKSQHAAASDYILQMFPKWFSTLRESGCRLTCIQIGGDIWSNEFVSKLAALGDGVFIQRGS